MVFPTDQMFRDALSMNLAICENTLALVVATRLLR